MLDKCCHLASFMKSDINKKMRNISEASFTGYKASALRDSLLTLISAAIFVFSTKTTMH